MRKMKDSGIEWVGKIPQDWRVSPLFCFFTEGYFPNIGVKNDNLLSLSFGNIIRKDINTKDGLLPASFEGYNIVQKNHIIVRTLDLQNDKRSLRTGLVKEESGIITSAYLDLVPKQDIHSPFYHYLLHVYDLVKVFYNMGNGVRQSLNFKEFSKLPLISPTSYEQKKIADYLDSKCSQIDSIIEKQKQIIEKLKEYKISLITEVVTKGLDPNVEMKNSGVEWIGKIPKHWNVLKLKFLFEDGNSGLKIGPYGSALKGKTLDKGPYKIYNQAHLIQNDFSISRHYISEETFNELSNYEVRPGDILFSMMGTIGKCRIMPQNQIPGIMDSHLLKSRLNKKILDNFFVYAYDKDYSNQVIDQLKFLSAGTIMDGLNSKILKNIYIAVPPIEEQNQILDYLDSKCSQIDTSITKKELIVEKLQEYKKSIIYEVVTGKREV